MQATRKNTNKTKSSTKKKSKKNKWDAEHHACARLLEEELEGLLQYLRIIHISAILLMIAATGALIFAIRMLFQNDQKAVIAFILIGIISIITFIYSSWALRPWVLPRFLLPMDLHDIEIDKLLDVFKDPEEYLLIVKNHIEVLTSNYLVTKLGLLQKAIAIFIIGIPIAVILSIALP